MTEGERRAAAQIRRERLMTRFGLLPEEWIEILLLREVGARLWALFEHLSSRGVPIDFRQRELAEVTGSCREVVCHTIHRWVREGRVRATRTGVRLAYALSP